MILFWLKLAPVAARSLCYRWFDFIKLNIRQHFNYSPKGEIQVKQQQNKISNQANVSAALQDSWVYCNSGDRLDMAARIRDVGQHLTTQVSPWSVLRLPKLTEKILCHCFFLFALCFILPVLHVCLLSSSWITGHQRSGLFFYFAGQG